MYYAGLASTRFQRKQSFAAKQFYTKVSLHHIRGNYAVIITGVMIILDICHLFYTGRIFGSQKTQCKKHPKRGKNKHPKKEVCATSGAIMQRLSPVWWSYSVSYSVISSPLINHLRHTSNQADNLLRRTLLSPFWENTNNKLQVLQNSPDIAIWIFLIMYTVKI